MRPGRRFQAAVWLCACTSAERAHAAMKEANREKAWMRLCPPARARSLPGNCGCSGTRSEPRPCGRPRLCAVRSHNQRLGRQEDDTQKHTHTHREGKKRLNGFSTGPRAQWWTLWNTDTRLRCCQDTRTRCYKSPCGRNTSAQILIYNLRVTML